MQVIICEICLWLKENMLIDLSYVESKDELHDTLALKLGFPDFYGKNWDAFWDCITDLVELPEQIIFEGTLALSQKLPKQVAQLQKCFEDLANEYPTINCKITWR